MQKFVKREGEDGPPDRRAIAANAKVSVQGRPSSRHSGSKVKLPTRGMGRDQNISAAIQPAPSRRGSGPQQKHDLYDTDAGSIDTTVNPSVFQDDHSQQTRLQTQAQPGHIADLDSEDKSDHERSSDDEGQEEVEEYNGDPQTYAFTQEEVDYLQERAQTHLSRAAAVEYLMRNRPRRSGFRTVDGDSYPSTTEGDPNELQGKQDLTSDAFGDGGPASPSPRPRINYGQAPAPVSLQRGPVNTGQGQPVGSAPAIFQQGAALRDQHRSNNNSNLQNGHGQINMTAPIPSSQPPAYSQVSRQNEAPQPVQSLSRPLHPPVFHQPPQPQQNIARQMPNPNHVTIQPTPAVNGHMTAKQPLAKYSQEVSAIQQPLVQHASVEHEHILADYDMATLYKMNYAELKKESFDKDPRAPDQPLGENMLEKPLVDRLEHVQKNLGPQKQADFFRSLPTTEWEDAGDWFLEQFSSIITRTKEARQKKRKLAKGFENEVEKRHKHVSKKQRQVKEAMEKMKTQGEGLVPRSPRPSKSPRPKKG